jgi:hypothetical protein
MLWYHYYCLTLNYDSKNYVTIILSTLSDNTVVGFLNIYSIAKITNYEIETYLKKGGKPTTYVPRVRFFKYKYMK